MEYLQYDEVRAEIERLEKIVLNLIINGIPSILLLDNFYFLQQVLF